MTPPASPTPADSRSVRLFLAAVVVVALGQLWYGLDRLTLGVDFTDEGAWLAWAMRMNFGEPPFVTELGTLLRPLAAYLYVVFKIHPAITLYEFRLLGWLVHLVAYAVLATHLYRISRAPLQSPLVASVPFFVCHLFGLATPSYNVLSSDFLLLALSLPGLAAGGASRRATALHVAGGFALFLATLAHPALGLVGAVILLHELLWCGLAKNVFRGQPSPSNAGILVFVACWLAFVACLVASGAAAVWFHRIILFQSFTVPSIRQNPLYSFLRLATYPFVFSPLAWLGTGAALAVAGTSLFPAYGGRRAPLVAAGLALFLLFSLLFCFSYSPDFLPVYFAQAALLLIVLHALGLTGTPVPADAPVRFSLVLSGLGALAYATVTYFFSPSRSWQSGILALPFAFATGLTLLLGVKPARFTALYRILATAMLALTVACVARGHYRSVYRDAPPGELTTTFQVPKLRHLHSTAERVHAVDALYAYLHPRLARGEPLLVFDDCPLLYYLFDAMPAYGLAFAERYTQSPAALAQLDREMNARPLPRYAIRLLVDPSHPAWGTAPRTNYDHYPLNETLQARYELERTIFPFEIWRLKPAAPGKKTSPAPPAG